ncbi:MAG TPA: DUF5677 domain-containing protein [Vicinamibacterales bacterium]|jgi:hypothetical protein
MAKDRPATRVESVGFDDLIPVARRLNTASDDLNAALKRIEERLNELGIGIARYVSIPETRDVINNGEDKDPEEWIEYQVGYDRLGDSWALMTRRAHFQDDPMMTGVPADCWRFDEEKPLLRASRDLRIKAVAAIPELLKDLKSEAQTVLGVVDAARRLAGENAGKTIEFEFGESVAANEFWDRNPEFFPSFQRLVSVTNKAFGREWRASNRMEDVAFNLGETCRQDFLEIAFLSVNGHGVAAMKLLRGLYERAVTLEYIRRNPDKAERFVRYGVIQEFKALKAAVEAVGEDAVKERMGAMLAEYQRMYDDVRPEFQVADCKKCKTRRLAFSWDDLDFASMVRTLGEPYQNLYMASYAIPNLHIHATATSAFSREPNFGTPEEKNVHEAEVSLIHATLIFVLVLNSESEVFSLGLDAETKACWDEVTTVWRDRPHGPAARRERA